MAELPQSAWYGGDPAVMGEENHADFLVAIRDPETVHAMLEDYRAGVRASCSGPPRVASRAGRRVLCLRGGGRSDSGHHMAEGAPEELVAALVPFLVS